MNDNSKNFENVNDIVPKLLWWFKKNPMIVKVGNEKYNLFKTLYDAFFNCFKKYHLGYGNENIYE